MSNPNLASAASGLGGSVMIELGALLSNIAGFIWTVGNIDLRFLLFM